MAGTLLLARLFNSVQLSIVAHIGMAVSLCFAFGMGLTDEKLALLLVYQAASVAVILLGNIFCCRKTYYFGLFVSLAVTIAVSCFMWGRFASRSLSSGVAFATELPAAAVAAAFFWQFAGASFLSYLLAVSTTRYKSREWQDLIHFSNKVLWIVSLFINVYFVVYRLVGAESVKWSWGGSVGFSVVFTAVAVTFAVVLVHGVLSVLLSYKFNFSGRLETFSVLMMSAVAAVLMLILLDANPGFNKVIIIPRLSWLIVVSVLLALAGYIAKNKAYVAAAAVYLVPDALFMFGGKSGYRVLNNIGEIWLPLVYLAFLNLMLWLLWKMAGDKMGEYLGVPAKIFGTVLTELSLVSIFVTSSIDYKTEILLIILVLLNTALYALGYDRDRGEIPVLKTAFGINEFAVLSVVSWFIAYDYKDSVSTLLYLVLFALSFGYAFLRVGRELTGKGNNLEALWTGAKLTVLTLAVIKGHTSWFEQAYIFSVVCMLTALLCIILGFAGKAKALRYYGLALTVACILKLVTYDVTNLETMLRVLAFIGGGVICFGISAIYNYTSKRLAAGESLPEIQEQQP